MPYPEPPSKKGEVRRAGKKISAGTATDSDFAMVDGWRASHGYVINTFQAWIKGHIARRRLNVEFAQRLKRKKTVNEKLERLRPDGVPLISDITTMHDLAGCRMIFNNIDELTDFREYMRSNDVMRNVDHELRHDANKYDYIENPKPSGYRGIHDVYRHFPRGHRRNAAKNGPWDGLTVEIQYRTRAQHAWATAVEISDLLDGERTKFDMTVTERGRFFALASEIIARTYEGKEKAFLGVSTSDLQRDLQKIENKLSIMQRLQALRQFEVEEYIKKHNVLNIYRDEYGNTKLEVISFGSADLAIKKATELEGQESSINAVYVRADDPKQLRSAYRNYFYDPIDFVELLKSEASLQ